ncbi:MAG: penicillin-binding protein 2 [Treponema sp.]|nr:penicillin-binding protein 2 [Treponema sp.]
MAEPLHTKTRIILLGGILAFFFIIYTMHLFSLQIVHGEMYQVQSQTIASQSNRIPAQRGEIFDRHADQPLAININSFSVLMIPGEIPSGYYDTVATRLAAILGISKYDIDQLVGTAGRQSFRQIQIKQNVSFATISNIAENRTDLPGVSWQAKPTRYYTETGSMAHIIGYVGDITQEELNILYNEGYTAASIIGKTGIERQYDAILRGTPGRINYTVDVRGRVISDTPIIAPPRTGNDVVLTVDTTIQKLAEQALGERTGAVVVLHPATGEVLAMVSYPYYDPNLFSSSDAGKQYQALIDNPSRPFLNRAINSQYPPASTFKTIMTAALLQEQVFLPTERIECTGKLVYGNRTFTCHIHPPGHGWLNLKNGLAQSCDVYFWVIGRDYLGIEKIAAYANEFGFGKSTGIDLPAQLTGLVPTVQWKERRYHERWLGGDTMSTAIGQGYLLATPLQVANMMAMVSNGGTIYRPHLLKVVRDAVTEEVLQEVQPEVLFSSNIAPDVWRTVQEDLRYTITNGTPAYPMYNRTVQIAGKTGTAEVAQYKDDWHSWMVAYAPYDAPPEERIVVAMIVEAGNGWEWWAPYATNIIFQGIFAHQTYDEALTALGFQYLRSGNRQSRQE